MKIAFFHELHKGGARRASNEFAGQLRKKHHIVNLYIVDEEVDKKESIFYDKIYLNYFKQRIWKGNDWKSKIYKDTAELYKLYMLHKRLAKEIDNEKYDLIFVQGSKYTQAPFLLRFIRTKNVYYCQEPLRMVYETELKVNPDIGFLKYNYENFNRFIRKKLDRKNILCADLVLANSKYTKENIRKAYGITAKVCYMGVDTKVFKPEKIKKTNDVLFIGAYGYMDGYPLLKKIIAISRHRYNLVVLASERKWIDNDRELGKLYSKSKLALALGVNEPFGLIPLEAMACGLPVIAVDDGGYKESVLSEKTGYLVQRNPQAISDKINYMLSNKEILKKMSASARSLVVDNWTWEKNAGKLEKILKNLK